MLRIGAQSISSEAPLGSALMTSALEILVWRWYWQEPAEKEGCCIQARHEGFLQGKVCYLEIKLQRGPDPTTYSLAGGAARTPLGSWETKSPLREQIVTATLAHTVHTVHRIQAGGPLPAVLRPVLSHLSPEQASQRPWDLASHAAAWIPLGFQAKEGERINSNQRCPAPTPSPSLFTPHPRRDKQLISQFHSPLGRSCRIRAEVSTSQNQSKAGRDLMLTWEGASWRGPGWLT